MKNVNKEWMRKMKDKRLFIWRNWRRWKRNDELFLQTKKIFSIFPFKVLMWLQGLPESYTNTENSTVRCRERSLESLLKLEIKKFIKIIENVAKLNGNFSDFGSSLQIVKWEHVFITLSWSGILKRPKHALKVEVKLFFSRMENSDEVHWSRSKIINWKRIKT